MTSGTPAMARPQPSAAWLRAPRPASTSFWCQAARFTAVGVGCTVIYLGLYWLLRDWFGPQESNVVASLLSAIVNTAVNRVFTFGVRGKANVAREQLQGLVLYGVSLGLTSGALYLIGVVPNRFLEISALALANFLGGLLRFVLFRVWVFNKPAH